MSQRVTVDHLLTIASDYWEGQYFSDFPGGAKSFTPTGRFGIGFLSVFMLGEEISVATERSGDSRYQLAIHGLGRRAELRRCAISGYSGSEVTITLKQTVAAELK
jgi:HSP90 family molecular chaperone